MELDELELGRHLIHVLETAVCGQIMSDAPIEVKQF